MGQHTKQWLGLGVVHRSISFIYANMLVTLFM